MSERPLILLTHNFPYGQAENFLEVELPYLKTQFKRIIIVPYCTDGECRPTPEGVEVDISFGHHRNIYKILYGIRGCFHRDLFPLIWKKISSTPSLLFRQGCARRLLAYISKAYRTYKWLAQCIGNDPTLENSVIYTYWFFEQSTAAGLIKQHYPSLKVVSRAHGHDVYEENYYPYYIPFRKISLEKIDCLFAISEDGKKYFNKKFSDVPLNCYVSRLGVTDPSFVAEPTGEGCLSIVSCSAVIPLKRVPLLIQSLAIFAQKHPHLKIQWRHIGGGEDFLACQQMAHALLTPHMEWKMLGAIPRNAVYNVYREHAIDLFAMLSETEGIPVSIMEAQACSIPVVSTAVGGVGEIVDEKCGFLLPKNPSSTEVAELFSKIATHKDRLLNMKIASRHNWEQNYNADKNYASFARELA